MITIQEIKEKIRVAGGTLVVPEYNIELAEDDRNVHITHKNKVVLGLMNHHDLPNEYVWIITTGSTKAVAEALVSLMSFIGEDSALGSVKTIEVTKTVIDGTTSGRLETYERIWSGASEITIRNK